MKNTFFENFDDKKKKIENGITLLTTYNINKKQTRYWKNWYFL